MLRSHDFSDLHRRWRAVARRAGVVLETLVEADGYPLFCLDTGCAGREDAVYISTGIHGDESAGPAALVAWAEENERRIRNEPFFLLPCLNPWGLVHNSREDASGADLNRAWDHPTRAIPKAVRRRLRGLRFELALTLHEDYDAEGFYIYEPIRGKPHWGEALVRAVSEVIPPDTRRTIEGRKITVPGLIRRRIVVDDFREVGLPEAVYLHAAHAERSFTFETPSELDLRVRVQAHRVLIEAAPMLRSTSSS